MGVIEVTVDGPNELFESLDRGTDWGRHLNERVEQFIVHRAEEQRLPKYMLVVRIPEVALSRSDSTALATGIRQHFVHRANEERAKVQTLIRDGKRDLMTGSVFLFVCGIVGLVGVNVLPRAIGLFLEQGLLILGWVALWRPVDLLLYELRPLRLRRDVLDALSKMDVRTEGRGEREKM